jgi:adenosylmethionine---8-amino-7-oxononanoate aminotransferase
MDDLIDLDRRNIWHPFTSLSAKNDPILIERAEGIYLYSNDGRKIIDAVSSWWVNLHGHSHPVIAKAVAKQAAILEHVIFAGFTHKPAIQLSQNILSILPKNQTKIFFSDNGSTAVEVGLKMAFQFWHNKGIKKKKKVVALQGSYHGDTFGSMSVGDRGAFTEPFSKYLFDVEFIEFPTLENSTAVVEQFKNIVKLGDVGAFVYEPLVQAAGGMRMYDATVLDAFLDVAASHDVVCVADEVFTGFGRTGKMFASDYLRNSPDIIALSKGLTGGTMALGITSCNERIVNAFLSDDVYKTFFHGHSFTANPIACAAANASFELLTSEACKKQLSQICRQQMDFCSRVSKLYPKHSVRCLGTIVAIELATDSTSYFNKVRDRILPYFLERNILLRPLGNVIYVLPPYVIRDVELSEVHNCIEAFLKEFERSSFDGPLLF